MAFNKLTNAQAERLALLSEELGEAQRAIGKILRHGYESRNPLDFHSVTNRAALEHELGDIDAALCLMFRARDVSDAAVGLAMDRKLDTVGKWLHHQTKRTRKADSV